MSVYQVRARRHTYPRLGNKSLSKQTVNWLIPDATVLGIDDDRRQIVSIELKLDRDDYRTAIVEIAGLYSGPDIRF
jgi:hypothetical protein